MTETSERVCKRHGNPANVKGKCATCYAEQGAKRSEANAARTPEQRKIGSYKHRLVLSGNVARDLEAYARSAAVVKKSSEAYQTLVLLIGERVIEHFAEDIDD